MTNVLTPMSHCVQKDLNFVKSAFDELSRTELDIQKSLVRAIDLYYSAGEHLDALVQMHPNKVTARELAATFALPYSRVRKSLKIYSYFRNNPSLMQNLSMSEAMRLMRGGQTAPEQKEMPERKHILYGGAAERPDVDWEEAFALPPMNRTVRLDNYRLCRNANELWLIHKGSGMAKLVELWQDQPADKLGRYEYDQMMAAIQKAVEKYYSYKEVQEGRNGSDT